MGNRIVENDINNQISMFCHKYRKRLFSDIKKSLTIVLEWRPKLELGNINNSTQL